MWYLKVLPTRSEVDKSERHNDSLRIIVSKTERTTLELEAIPVCQEMKVIFNGNLFK